MAEHLSAAVKPMIIGCLFWGAPLYASSFALAQVLIDPTRPPASIDAANPSMNVPLEATTGPVLQSVIISPHRVEAIINGQVVKTGDKFGDAKVVKIAEGEVVLLVGKDLQTLKLFPNVEKRPYSGRVGAGAVDNRRQ